MFKRLMLLMLFTLATPTLFSAEPLNTIKPPVPLVSSSLQPKVLAPEEAFRIKLGLPDAHHIQLQWNIAKGYYLYQEKIKITSSHEFIFDFPKGNKMNDEFFGEQIVYFNQLNLHIPLPRDLPEEFELMVTYQGCATAGFCYPPISETWSINRKTGYIEIIEASHAAGAAELAEIGTLTSANPITLSELITETQQTWVWVIFYILGLLLAFTPCVLPMIPILSSIIVGHHAPDRSWRAFSLSVCYVGGMAITYSLAGVFAGLAGQTLQSYLQAPLFVGVCALLLILLALNSFGFYQLQIPSPLRQAMAQTQDRIKGGRFISALLLGVISALIVSPCVTAPLIGALTYISLTGDTWLGGTTLFALALGMGTPLLILGSFGPRLLPRSGRWLVLVQRLFGILLIAVAIWMVMRVLPVDIFAPSVKTEERAAMLESFVSANTVEELQHEINKSLKPVMVDIYADWCVTCHIIEDQIFPDPKVAELLKHFTLIRVDVTAQNKYDKEIQKELGVFAPPALLFFQPAGPELINKRLVGDITADQLTAQLESIIVFHEKSSPTL